MPDHDCDIAIIGAGIHGAGVAQVAACNGWSCVVLERGDVAAGTSSRSSKLIHGGLRYLEQMQFGLVRECLHERSRLLRVAPELVRLIPFYLPLYSDGGRHPLLIRTGLTLYALLAGSNPGSGFAKVARRDWAQLDGLRQNGLRGVFRYHDAQTDDAALTRAVMASAVSRGAVLWRNTEVQALHREPWGYRLGGERSTGPFEIRARVVVNVAGPWIGSVASRTDPPLTLPAFSLVQGAHLILPDWQPVGAFTLQSPIDRRVMFVLPWRGGALLGSTETPFAGDPAETACTAGEEAYLLASLAHFFPKADTRVSKRFAGVRVLPAGAANSASREALLPVDDPHRPRLVTLIGGKLTSYHPTARAMLARLRGALPPAQPECDAGELPLHPPP